MSGRWHGRMFVRRYFGSVLLALTCCACFHSAYGDFVVKDVRANLVQKELHVSTNIELNLSEQSELAVDNGVPLVVLTEFALIRNGVLWSNTMFETRNGQILRYHSLADRYVVEDMDDGTIDTYRSVQEALESMGAQRSLVFELPQDIQVDASGLTLAVRSRLDLNRLPIALRPLAFFSPYWQLASDWTLWQIESP